MELNDNFKLLSNTEKTIDFINKQLVNFPKTEYLLKENIEKSMYGLIKAIFSYRIEDISRIKLKYLKDLLIDLSMLDYYVRLSYKKKIISQKKLLQISNFLLEIKKISYGVIRNEKSIWWLQLYTWYR